MFTFLLKFKEKRKKRIYKEEKLCYYIKFNKHKTGTFLQLFLYMFRKQKASEQHLRI